MVKKKSIYPYLLVLPAVLMILCVVFVPVVNAILMSFQNYDLRRPNERAFIALANYIAAFTDRQFIAASMRTLIWVVVGVGLQFLLGFVLALMFHREFFGRGLARAVSMVPWVTPGVLIGLMWRWIFDGNYGVCNDLLLKLRLISDSIPFLSRIDTAFPSVILTIIWQGIPFFALMLLAGLQGISRDMYEASSIDGANDWQNLIHITVPSLKNTILTTGLLRIIWVANSVDVIFNMTEGGPAYSTQTLSVMIFNKANALNLGYASSMAILLALMMLIVVIPYLRMTFKRED